MRAVVVYESLFGNTHAVADAIAEGIRELGDATVLSVADASAEAISGADLLVVGGPTHAHGMASSLTHKAAQGEHEHVDEAAAGPALRGWFHDLPSGDGVRAAAFDTRLPGSALKTGSAAKGIERRLRHHGYDVLDGSASFVVEDAEGPLREGELERARSWGAGIAASV